MFNLKRPGTDGDMSPITIDCGFIAVLEGFSTEGAFSKLQPILGSGTVWEGGDECPWAYNCGVMLSWNEGGAENRDISMTVRYMTKAGGAQRNFVHVISYGWLTGILPGFLRNPVSRN